MIDANTYSDDLTKALNSNSIAEMKKFLAKHCHVLPPAPDDKVLEVAMRKMQLGKVGVRKKIKREAAIWLLERGLSLWVN